MKRKSNTYQKSGKTLFFYLFSVILGATLLAPGYAFSSKAKTDFSGTWVLNEDKSEMGEGRFRRSAKVAIEQDGDNLKLERTRTGRDGQEMTTSQDLTLDGKEVVNEGENRTTKTTATWSEDGKSLNINSAMAFTREGQTMESTSKEVWTLSEDGKTLTIQYTGSSQRGETKATLVYDKQ